MKFYELLVKSSTRKARIDKKNNKSIVKRVDVYANRIINNYIVNSQEYGLDYRPSNVYNGLLLLNKDKIDKEYAPLIYSKKTPSTLQSKVLVQRMANDKAISITDAQYSRLNSNIQSIEKVLRNYELNLDKYKELNNKTPLTVSRRGIVTESIDNINTIRSAGVNIVPNVYGYQELSPLTEGLHRQSQIQAGNEKALLENENAISNGDEPANTYKTWIWTGIGKTTRHESNNGKTVKIDETFTIVNDIDGQVDEMMHPLDPNVDSSNGYICYCEVEYHNNSDGYQEPETFSERLDDALAEVNRRLNSLT